jgi:hypothetical protein
MRKPMLRQVLQHYCALMPELIERIVLVDYDEQFSIAHDLYEPLAHVQHLKVVVSDERYFNKSRAINLGVALSGARYIVVCDADVTIPAAALVTWARLLATDDHTRRALTPVHMIETATGLPRPAPGIVAFEVGEFLAVQGYSSEFIGWGFEDRDFLWRLAQAGVEVSERGYASHISHDELERTRNYAQASEFDTRAALADRLRMRERNLHLFAARQRAHVKIGTLAEDLSRFGLTRLLAHVEAQNLGSRVELYREFKSNAAPPVARGGAADEQACAQLRAD